MQHGCRPAPVLPLSSARRERLCGLETDVITIPPITLARPCAAPHALRTRRVRVADRGGTHRGRGRGPAQHVGPCHPPRARRGAGRGWLRDAPLVVPGPRGGPASALTRQHEMTNLSFVRTHNPWAPSFDPVTAMTA